MYIGFLTCQLTRPYGRTHCSMSRNLCTSTISLSVSSSSCFTSSSPFRNTTKTSSKKFLYRPYSHTYACVETNETGRTETETADDISTDTNVDDAIDYEDVDDDDDDDDEDEEKIMDDSWRIYSEPGNKCLICFGKGYSKCLYCYGKGVVKIGPEVGRDTVKCPQCDGTAKEFCRRCEGTGVRPSFRYEISEDGNSLIKVENLTNEQVRNLPTEEQLEQQQRQCQKQ